jgi:hypothetical protein
VSTEPLGKNEVSEKYLTDLDESKFLKSFLLCFVAQDAKAINQIIINDLPVSICVVIKVTANGKAFVFVAELAFRQLEQMLIKNTKVEDKIYCPIYNVKFEQKFNDAIS